MTITPTRDMVKTPEGLSAILPDDHPDVPIHYVAEAGVLLPNGHWNATRLTEVIGQPAKYDSHITTVRLFIVLPGLSLTELRFRELMELLHVYADAGKNDLAIELTYYPYGTGRPKKEFFNIRDHDADQKRLLVEVLGSEIINFFSQSGSQAGRTVMELMHITPGFTDLGWHSPRNIDAMAQGATLRFPRNTRLDFNTLVVHRVANGKLTRAKYPLRSPSYGNLAKAH